METMAAIIMETTMDMTAAIIMESMAGILMETIAGTTMDIMALRNLAKTSWCERGRCSQHYHPSANSADGTQGAKRALSLFSDKPISSSRSDA